MAVLNAHRGIIRSIEASPQPWFFIGLDPSGHVVTVPPRGLAIVLGEPGTGKSTALIQVNALPWQLGPTLVRSTRPDNRHRVLVPNLAAGRRCLLLNLDGEPTTQSGCEPLRISLLDLARSWPGARELALRLVRASREPGVGLDGTDTTFEDYAAELFGALLFAARLGREHGLDLSLADVAEWFADLRSGVTYDPLAIAERLLTELGGNDGRHALGGLDNVAEDRSNRRDTIQKVSEAVGHLLTGPPLAALAAADRTGPTDLDEVIRCGAMVFIEVSDDHPARSRSHAALSALVEDDLVAAGRRSWRSGAARHPLRLLYDESATGSVNPNIATWAATGAGDGIALMICAQSLSQLDRVFPKEGAGLVNAFNHRLFLRGHALDGERVSPMFGQHEVEVTDRGWSRPLLGLPSRHGGTRRELRPRVTPDDLVRIPNGYGLMVSAGHLGRVRLVPAFSEPWASRFPS